MNTNKTLETSRSYTVSDKVHILRPLIALSHPGHGFVADVDNARTRNERSIDRTSSPLRDSVSVI